MAAPDLHAGHDYEASARIVRPTSRAAAVRRARWLNAATIGWNSVEGVIAVTAGVIAGSVSLVGFGLDSAIEVSAALILTWRLRQEKRDSCTQDADSQATKLIAVSFGVLAAYVAVEAVRDLTARSEPEASVPGVVLAVLSLVVMPSSLEPKPVSPPSSARPRRPPTPPKRNCARSCRASC